MNVQTDVSRPSAQSAGRTRRLLIAMLLLPAMPGFGQDGRRQPLEYAPAPADNPLKGLVPYAADRKDPFPHSMEFQYLPLSALVVGEDRYDWQPLENLLTGTAKRGHQSVFRVFLEYPGRKNVIPDYLLKAGLKVHRYTHAGSQPPAEIETPDYADRNLRRCLKAFIAALGKKYDGDPRIGFITAGLLGTWGEWHTYPRQELWAGKDVQAEVLDAYEAAFKTTPILLRYPAGDNDPKYVPNAARRFGYHDDSFAWATLDTGRRGDEWFFMALLKRAAAAMDKWKTHPIGGEIRPEAWGKVFDEDPGEKHIQSFAQCVKETHVTWLMDSGVFKGKTPEPRRTRAEQEVRRMGYEFHVPAITLAVEGKVLTASVELENRGVAPFYYDWPDEFALLSAEGKPQHTFAGSGKLTGLLPGEPARVWTEKFPLEAVRPGRYLLALCVPNPMPGGKPLRFANKTQDQHCPGWLTLGAVVVP